MTTSPIVLAPRIRVGHPSRRHAGVGFWLVSSAFLVVMAFNTVPTPLWPLYQEVNGMSTLAITLAFAAYALGVLISLFLGGHISDWHGRRRILLPAIGIEIIAAIILLSSTALPALLIARFVGGLGVGLLTATATAFGLELYAHARPGRAVHFSDGVLTTANLGGLGAGPLVAGLLAAFVPGPLTTVYAVFLVLLVLAGIAIAIAPETVTREHRTYRPQRVVVPASSRPRYLLLGLGAFLSFTLFGLFTSVAPKILGASLGVTSPAVSGAVAAAVFAVAVVAQLALGRARPARQLTTGLILLALGFVLLLIAGLTSGLAVFVAGAVVGGAGAGALFKSVMVSARAMAEDGAKGEALAGMFLAAYLGMALPVIGLAVVADIAGLTIALMSLSAVVLVLIVVAGIGLIRTRRAA